jgi:hypothetical protein
MWSSAGRSSSRCVLSVLFLVADYPLIGGPVVLLAVVRAIIWVRRHSVIGADIRATAIPVEPGPFLVRRHNTQTHRRQLAGERTGRRSR